MTNKATFEIDPSLYKVNLKALQANLPDTAEQVAMANPPASLQPTIGRDGANTLAWTDESGRICWLGRTSMPTISTKALADSFEPGSGNVLLFGFGQGGEVRQLLTRLAAHQAVLVIDETPWMVGAALKLYDFAADIKKNRLLIFTGSEPWDDCREFLSKHDGFLAPERVLSWPWYEKEIVAYVSDRLTSLQSAVSEHRSSKQTDRKSILRQEPAIAFLSNLTDPRIHHLARRMVVSADNLGWPCEGFVLDNPALVHPQTVSRALDEFDSSVAVLIDVGPQALPYSIPDVPIFILCSHPQPLSKNWLKQIPQGATLGVQTDHQRRQAVDCGLSETRIAFLPPAAMPGISPVANHRGSRILFLGDCTELTAQSAGLHLASHRRLWEAATDIITEQIDTYQDEHADAVIVAAERRIGISLDSDEVRHGIVKRIKHRLAPTLARRAYCTALSDAGIAFDVYGAGWAQNEKQFPYYRGEWPDIGEEAAFLADYDLVISVETSGHVIPQYLDALAAGLVGFVRTHPHNKTHDGLGALIDPDEHVWSFTSRHNLTQLISRFIDQPDDFRQRAIDTAKHINNKHTWCHRLVRIVEAVNETDVA